MKKLTDEEIQKLLDEQAVSSFDSIDMKTYQLLFEALEEAPSEGLPMGFADQVVREAAHISLKRQIRYYWLLIGASILIALSASMAIIFFYQQPSAIKILAWLAEARWIILFGLLMFALVQVADYRLVNRKQTSH